MNTEEFKSALGGQVRTFALEHGSALQLAPNIFLAQIREVGDCSQWTNVYYYDDREAKVRDEAGGVRCMSRETQLMMAMGFTGNGMLSEDPDDHVRIAYLETDLIGDEPTNVLNFATQIFVGVDNEELPWFDAAKTVPI